MAIIANIIMLQNSRLSMLYIFIFYDQGKYSTNMFAYLESYYAYINLPHTYFEVRA